MFQCRNTSQKLAIAAVLHRTRDHPSAADVHTRVRQLIPNVSLATVYRNLDSMAASGCLTRIVGTSQCRYDVNTEPHHHLVCLGCERLLDVPPGGGLSLAYPESLHGCRVTGAQLLFFGYCPDCLSG